MILSTVIRREFSWKMVHDASLKALQTCGMIMWIGIGTTALVGVFNLMGGTANPGDRHSHRLPRHHRAPRELGPDHGLSGPFGGSGEDRVAVAPGRHFTGFRGKPAWRPVDGSLAEW